MAFNSYSFIFLFLPITLIIYFILNRNRLLAVGTAWLSLTSLFFYSHRRIDCLPIFAGSILLNYIAGKFLQKYRRSPNKKKIILISGLFINIATLLYYKYPSANSNLLLGLEVSTLILPLGISFFTFIHIAFLIDIYCGKIERFTFSNYILFVTFFPHLVAGPIIHYNEIVPQFNFLRNKVLNWKNLTIGTFLFSVGLFKKIVVADNLSVFIANGFDLSSQLNLIEAWVTSLSYTLQIYFDFSGYTDMALGAALTFNIRLPTNFDSPYKALNLSEFWRRWHITLSRFLKDYIYVPLGGNRKSEIKTYRNLLLVFLIGGLWHGSGLTFLFWGFLHGMGTVVNRIWWKTGIKMNSIIAWFLTFNFINICWVFFRARTWGDAIKVLKGMAGLNGVALPERLGESLAFLRSYGVDFSPGWFDNISEEKVLIFSMILIFLPIILFSRNSGEMSDSLHPNCRMALFMILITITALNMLGKVKEFLYLQF